MNAASESRNSLSVGPFLQDIATIFTDIDDQRNVSVLAIACMPTYNGSEVYAGTAHGLFRRRPDSERWERFPDGPFSGAPIRLLQADSARCLWLATMQEAYQINSDKTVTLRHRLEDDAIVGIAGDSTSGARLLVLTRRNLIDIDSGGKVTVDLPSPGRALCLSPDGSAVIATENGLYLYANRTPVPFFADGFGPGSPEKPPSTPANALTADNSGGIWSVSADGVAYYTHKATLEITAKDGLPVKDCRSLAAGSDGALWIGTHKGAIRLLDGKWRYYAGRRWLPDDRVSAIAADKDGSAWIATEGGLSHIRFDRTTFPKKAAHYERITAARHNRDGYVTDCGLTVPGDLSSFLYEASDNDGLWTAMYMAAECFRYAVTKDKEAYDLARKSLRALLLLVGVTGIPGFPARAIIRKNERVRQSDPGPNWYPSPVYPDVLFKNDTSSDEIDGHYFAWFVYSELAADPHEKREIAEVCRAVTNHILDNDYTLVGPTGRHTRWGVWTPDRLNGDPDWAAEQGLNSLEILSHLKVAVHLCGDARFQDAYIYVIGKCNYALNTVCQKLTPPEGENNHSDDELAALAYYPLLLLETDPDLLRLYRLSLERTQKVLRLERSPFHNLLYGACGGEPCDLEASAQSLRDAPWDLRGWTMDNSHRDDVAMDRVPGRFHERQMAHVLPPSEQRVVKWNHNPYEPDGGSGGRHEEDGTFWLLPYWMGRYHGLLREATRDQQLSVGGSQFS